MIPDGVEVRYVPAQVILPDSVRSFLLAHELYHVRDMRRGTFRTDHWIRNEIEANLHAARSQPLGLLLTLVWSLRPVRLRYYWDRYISGGRYA